MAIFSLEIPQQNAEAFILYPFECKCPKRIIFLPKQYQKIIIQGNEYAIRREMLTFIRHKTKESLESKGRQISIQELKEKIKHLTRKNI
ncbi:hypothetical protein [Helicobacter sp. MIT 05-5294]|uniref:hypothetical protein n=1 Tax=Helicobacter sp. MIT 05-5294 TaxID=1548150 RepID=UPI000A9C64CE|nr:hypothetical protein [Helicobacter sp. MIT 05-5294]TLD87785.1 hypothetical protein LS69_003030 [Helicobacter sp. MIT 05-5294]